MKSMMWTKTKIFILLGSLLALHAPILQAALSQCEQDGRNFCNQPCIDAVPTVQECLVANPTLPPPACIEAFNLGVAACEAEITVDEAACESAYNIANSCPVGDVTAPRIIDIVRLSPSTIDTDANSLVWRIAFDESVKNIDNTDFTVTGTTATVTGVSAATGAETDITVSGGDLAGLNAVVTLSLSGAQNIADTADNALANTTPTNTNDNSFTVENAVVPDFLTFTFINSTGNGVTGDLVIDLGSPVPVGTFIFTPTNAASQVIFNIDYSAIGGGIEQADSVAALCLAQNPNFPPGVCALHQGYQPQRNAFNDIALTIATVNGQRRIDGGAFPSVTFINDFGSAFFDAPKLTFSSTLGGDAITFNGTTIFGDWVGNSVITNTNNIGVVTITGTAVEGVSLSAGVSDADGVTGSNFSYQWKSNGTNVGANQSTYEVQGSDVGNAITVQVTYTDQLSTAENIISAATASVVSVTTNALNTISAAANNSGGSALTVDDFKEAGLVSIVEEDLIRVLSILNYAVANQATATDVDEVSEIEALIATILLGQDDDADGLPNLLEGNADTDGDGKSDDNDNDADNDGIADWLEHGLVMDDTDSDGIIDVLDADVDGDGTLEAGKLDANVDGVDDNLDSLAKLFANDANLDRDNDGQVNYLDLDSDNDGALDVVEAQLGDVDFNGLVDAGTALIIDAANLPNTNADNTPNIFELISDGTSRDLIVFGLSESFDENKDGILDSTIDMDNDGIIDIIDGAVGAFGSFKDFDGDGLANHADPDDDNDGILDIDENPRQVDFTGIDADADGIDDGVDYDVNGTIVGVDADGNGIRDDKEMPDADNDGIADHLDNDGDNDGVTDDKDASVNTGDDFKTSAGAMTPSLIFALFGVLLARLYSRKRLVVKQLVVKRLVVVGLLMSIAPVSITQAQAEQWELGLGIGRASFDPELAAGLSLTEDTDTAIQVSLAYVFDESWLAELRYADLGKAEINSVTTVDHKVTAVNVQYTLPIPKLPIEKMSLYVLAGVAVIDLEGSDGLNIEDERSTELSVGIGTRYHFSDWLVRAEFASYNENSSAFMLGSHYRF